MYVNNSTETIDPSNLLGSLKPSQLKHTVLPRSISSTSRHFGGLCDRMCCGLQKLPNGCQFT